MKKELRILMLEDTATDAELMEHELRKAGLAFVPKRVDTREAFIHALDDFRPDIILSDYRLPDFDGMAALGIVQRGYPEVPVIMVTGVLPDIEAVELIHAGAKDYVLKDRLARLAPAVQRALAAAEAVRERKLAEDQIRESERRYRSLFDNMLEGYAHCRMIFEADQPEDFIYLEVNAAFEKLTGLKNVIGKSVTGIIPGIRASNPELFEIYGRVSLTGKPEWFETYLPALEKWFSISVYGAEQGSFIAVFDNITERKRAEEKILNLTRLYATLSHTNTTIVRARNREELFCSICKGAVEQGEFVLAWIGLVDEATRTVNPVCHYGAEAGYLTDIRDIGISIDDVPTGQGPSGIAVRENRVCFVNDYEKDERMLPWREAALKHGFHGVAGIPLSFKGNVIGALTLYTKELNFFDAEQLDLLEEMTLDISFALDGLEREALRRQAEGEREAALNKLQISLESSIQIAASITEMRDPYTSGHQQRVARLATAIAREMVLSEEMIRGLHFGAMIHDIGKIAVPAEILSKPSRLSNLEYSLIKAHPQTGYDILKEIDFPWPIAQMVMQHHERLDGSGYPQGLAGDAILLEARIIAVADVVEAISSHRPYRPGLGIDAALEEIEHYRDTHYDPSVVDACVTLIRKHGYNFLLT